MRMKIFQRRAVLQIVKKVNFLTVGIYKTTWLWCSISLVERVRELSDLMKLVCLFVSQNCNKTIFYLSFWREKQVVGCLGWKQRNCGFLSLFLWVESCQQLELKVSWQWGGVNFKDVSFLCLYFLESEGKHFRLFLSFWKIPPTPPFFTLILS